MMDAAHRSTISHLMDMFNGSVEENVIEAVLIQREWNVDQALDDLMIITSNNAGFEIPLVNETDLEIAISAVKQPQNSVFHDPFVLTESDCKASNMNTLHFTPADTVVYSEEVQDDDSDDDIIVENKEEYDLESDSDTEDEQIENNMPIETKLNGDPVQISPAAVKSVPIQPPKLRPLPPLMLYAGYTSFDRIKKVNDCIERVKLYAQNGFKIMVLLRGCAGSGKSHLARDILEKSCPNAVNPYWHIHSTDNYFYLSGKGVYEFDRAKLPDGHQWSLMNIMHVAKEGLTPIIVDNTHVKTWEMQKCVEIAVCAGYEIEVIEPATPWFFKESELVRKNSHSVNLEVIRNMLTRYEHNVTPLSLLKTLGLEYEADNVPPQPGTKSLTDPKLIAVFENIRRKCQAVPPQRVKKEKREKKKQEKNKTKLTRSQRKKQKKLKKTLMQLAIDVATKLGSGSEGEEEDRENGEDVDDENEPSELETRLLDSEEGLEEAEDEDSDESDCSFEAKDVTVMMPAFVSRNLEESNSSSDSIDDDSWSTTEDSGDESNADAVVNFEIESKRDESERTNSTSSCLEDLLNDQKIEHEPTSCDSHEDNCALLSESKDDITNKVDLTLNKAMAVNQKTTELRSTPVETQNTQNYMANDLLSNLTNNGPRLKCFEQLHDNRIKNDISDMGVDCEIFEKNKNIFLVQDAPKEVVKEKSLSPIGSKKFNNITKADESTRDLSQFDNDESDTNRCSPNFELEAFKRSWNISKTALSQESVKSSLGGSSFETAISDDFDFDLNRLKANAFKSTDELDSLRSATPELERNNEGRCVRNKLCNVENQLTNETDRFQTYLSQDIFKSNRTNKVVNVDALIMDKFGRNESNDQAVEISSSLGKNVIENRLWDEDDGGNESDGSGSSESSSLDVSGRIEDIHNSVNRFVNNDINRDPTKMERKRANINRQKELKNRFAEAVASVASSSSSSSSDDELGTFESATVPELNTLKERILINSLEKVFNQSPLESSEEKQSNLSRKTSATVPIHLIENNLQESNEMQMYWNTWLKGDGWDEQQPSATQQKDRNEMVEVKSPRTKESPSKQKNSDTSTIRLVNDISSSSCERKNINKEIVHQRLAKSSNAEMQQQQQNTADDVLKFTSTKTINLFPNIPTNDPWVMGEELLRKKLEESKSTTAAEISSTTNVFPSKTKEGSDRLDALERDDFFIDKATNTGISDCSENERVRVTHCREINKGSEELEPSLIEARYNCDKSTMTETSTYTVKAKPLWEDVANLFPTEMIDTILDLYDKCEGNMDWIMETLMDDGYFPTDEQLDYLSSLPNVMKFVQSSDENRLSSSSTANVTVEKKKSRNRRKKKKTMEMVNSAWSTPNEETKSPKDENQIIENVGEETFVECVDLYLDWELVRQLMSYFGNPTVYPVQDFQPIINVPVSLARQIHAHLIESVIEQAEQNECLINQITGEDTIIAGGENFTQKDVTDVENSLSDILINHENDADGKEIADNVEQNVTETVEPIRSGESFSAKLSLNLLLKAFPTLEKKFVTKTFKSQNYRYYDTKKILNQYKEEIPIPSTSVDSPTVEQNDTFEEDDFQLFDNSTAAISRNEAIEHMKNFREEATRNYQQWQRCNEKLKMSLTMKEFGAAAYYREMMHEFKQKYEKCNAQAAAILVTSCCFQNGEVIDLHFFKVSEALKALDKFLDHHINKLASSGRQKCVLYVITGRGTRSAGGVSHLQPAILVRLKRRNIESTVETSNTGLVKAVIRKGSSLSHEL